MMTWVVAAIGLLAAGTYLFMGCRTYRTYFWCFGTAHNGRKTRNQKLFDFGLTLLLIFLWPLFYIGLFFIVVTPALIPHKRIDRLYTCDSNPNGQYRCLGKSKGAGDSRGETTIVYQDIKTKQLYHRTEDNFYKRMKLK